MKMQVITFSDFVILYLERNYLDKFCDCVVGKMRGTYEKYYKNNISDICSYSDAVSLNSTRNQQIFRKA